MNNSFSYVEDNFSVLKKMKYFPIVKRSFLFLTCGPNLIYAISELLLNLIINSNRKNLTDKKTILLIKSHYSDIGTLINNKSSLKRKREIISENKIIQNLALNIELNGYEFYKGETRKNNK